MRVCSRERDEDRGLLTPGFFLFFFWMRSSISTSVCSPMTSAMVSSISLPSELVVTNQLGSRCAPFSPTARATSKRSTRWIRYISRLGMSSLALCGLQQFALFKQRDDGNHCNAQHAHIAADLAGRDFVIRLANLQSDQPVRTCNASRYLTLVRSITSAGRAGPGVVLSQSSVSR